MQTLIEGHARYEENAKWISEHYEELKTRYDDEWVAVLNGSIIAHDRSFKRLLRHLKREYQDAYGEIAVEYVTKKPINMIL